MQTSFQHLTTINSLLTVLFDTCDTLDKQHEQHVHDVLLAAHYLIRQRKILGKKK